MNIEEAANALGAKVREVVRVEKDGDGHKALTFDGNLVHIDADGRCSPAGRVSDEELAAAKVKAADEQGPAEAPAPAKTAKR